MKTPPPGTEERVAKMTFASLYPLYLAKVTKKGRTEQELNQVLGWLTGYDKDALQNLIEQEVTIDTFFAQCSLNANVNLIKGVICGYRVEEMEESLLKQARYMDKLVDELAKGKKMEKILREGD